MSDRLLVSTRKGLMDVRRGRGGDWRVENVHFLGVPVVNTLRDPRNAFLFASLDHGHYGAKLHRSTDDGKSWEEMTAPSYQGMAGDVALQMIWTLAAGGADQAGVLWAGTLPGGLFKSEDNGESWSLNEPLWSVPEKAAWMGGGYDDPGIHSICVDPRDSNRVLLGLSVAGVWLTEDSGASWSLSANGMWAAYVPPDIKGKGEIQDPHLIQQCASAPDTYWCQHHNGLFVSNDAAKSWQEMENAPVSNFGFPVAVHPQDPKTAWFVPAQADEARFPVDGQVIVNRTRDGGQSFETLREGLPQTHAYDLVYRHAFVVDETGDRLAMGSTTGALWISENGGDTWATVNAHLPPIYAIEFL
ncbi:MAG: exo-alpha-sialidase [Alphaproteobacteria bacterium]|nr:MAG: exo-alpha-sialidase [Alphaproteobacteria bacterium]